MSIIFGILKNKLSGKKPFSFLVSRVFHKLIGPISDERNSRKVTHCSIFPRLREDGVSDIVRMHVFWESLR